MEATVDVTPIEIYNCILQFQVLADTVEMLGRAGIYTILDCHQDLWSPKFCGEQRKPAAMVQ